MNHHLIHLVGQDVLVGEECDAACCCAEDPVVVDWRAVVDGHGSMVDALQDARGLGVLGLDGDVLAEVDAGQASYLFHGFVLLSVLVL